MDARSCADPESSLELTKPRGAPRGGPCSFAKGTRVRVESADDVLTLLAGLGAPIPLGKRKRGQWVAPEPAFSGRRCVGCAGYLTRESECIAGSLVARMERSGMRGQSSPVSLRSIGYSKPGSRGRNIAGGSALPLHPPGKLLYSAHPFWIPHNGRMVRSALMRVGPARDPLFFVTPACRAKARPEPGGNSHAVQERDEDDSRPWPVNRKWQTQRVNRISTNRGS